MLFSPIHRIFGASVVLLIWLYWEFLKSFLGLGFFSALKLH
jgi:hypothetical protein